VQQEGAVITPKRAKALRFSVGGGKSIFSKRVVIPARPYLLIKPDDPQKIVEAVEASIGE
jgi:phage gpG-like protein